MSKWNPKQSAREDMLSSTRAHKRRSPKECAKCQMESEAKYYTEIIESCFKREHSLEHKSKARRIKKQKG